MCGYLNCDQRFSPLVEGLPTMLLVRSRDDSSAIEAVDTRGSHPTAVPQGSGTWLGTTLKFTISEARAASEAAFNRAFKRATGSPPATWRRGAVGAP